MKTKNRPAALSSKRFSRRLRIRERNEIAKNSSEPIDTRKSPDQFQQNEFLKLFDLESTCNSTDQTQSQQTSTSHLHSSTNSLSLNEVCRGFPLTPLICKRKRSRSGNRKPFNQNKCGDMSTHLPEQILLSTMSFGKHRPALAYLIGMNRTSYDIFCSHFHCR